MKETTPLDVARHFSGTPHNQFIGETSKLGEYRMLEQQRAGSLLSLMNIGALNISSYDKQRAYEVQSVGMQLLQHGVWGKFTDTHLKQAVGEMNEEEFSANVKNYLHEAFDFHKRNRNGKQGYTYISTQDTSIVILSHGLTGNFFDGEAATGMPDLSPTDHKEIIESARERFVSSMSSWMLGR